VVPIYIQEKIHPQAIIDDLMAQPNQKPGDRQLSLSTTSTASTTLTRRSTSTTTPSTGRTDDPGDSLLVMTSLPKRRA